MLSRLGLTSICSFLAAILLFTASADAATDWAARDGRTILQLDRAALDDLGLWTAIEWDDGSAVDVAHTQLAITPLSDFGLSSTGGMIDDRGWGGLVHRQSLRFAAPSGEVALNGFVLRARDDVPDVMCVVMSANDLTPMLDIEGLKVGFDRVAGRLLIECSGLIITRAMAEYLGDADLAGRSVGTLTGEVMLDWVGGDDPDALMPTNQATPRDTLTVCGNPGADVIVGDLDGVCNYSSVGGIEAFSVGTVSCNIGNENLLWIASNNQHPVIGQNMFRLKTMGDGSTRFEQIGQSWLKHGFTALTQNICDCGCNGVGGDRLGVGCSDPYVCSLNGSQGNLGPRFEVNAHTGGYLYPFTGKDQTGNSIYKRLQVNITDLDPALNGGGSYFVEGHYVTPDDAAAGNQNNNASYRPVTVSGSGTSWNASVTGETVREQAAIRAWGDTMHGVSETNVQVPGDGLVIIAGDVTDIGGGMYHYEYAVQNLNCDRSVGSFSIPVGGGATVQNIGFHDVDYHSGEPYDGTDWPGTYTGGAVTWSTQSYAANQNANALRWGTLYNFRFDANVPPAAGLATLGLFKPGTPNSVQAVVVGPDAGPLDCNNNSIDDATDIANGTSADCNSNSIPDECESFQATPISAVRIATGLTRPVFVCSPPDDASRLFIVEQDGTIRILSGGSVLATPFLDISSLINSAGNEQGLLSMAFHPNYASNGHFFVDYTDLSGDTVVARYSVSANPDIANAGSALILLSVAQDFTNHNGGQLQFGPDGYLYVGMGDGGSGNDPNERAQDLTSLLGKMLRLDVDAVAPYIPATNPFVGISGADEIWAYGLRNPWRFSFDRQTGDMYIADVGQNTWEEVDFQPAGSVGGENYGWDCREGAHCLTSDVGCDCNDPTLIDPILEYSHTGGACSITGGYVYRGCAMPDLAGTYFYAEYCAAWIRSFRYDAINGVTEELDRTTELTPATGAISAIVSFGEDADGELYIVSLNGSVYKIVPLGGGGGVCGDGNVDPGEECDDGNDIAGDGCYECQLENNDDCVDAIPVCPGTYDGTTSGMTVDGSSSCGSSGSSPDVWYSYAPTSSGSATVDLCAAASYDTVISVHTGCPGTSANQVAGGCDDDGCGSTGGPSTVTFSAVGGTLYYIRVSGYSGSSGTFTLTISGPDCAAAAVCGNGIIEPGEDCDPPGPGCDASCHAIVCETVIFNDDFESGNALGWNLRGPGSTAITGDGVIGDPNGTISGTDPAQPEDAFEGTGCLFTAQNTDPGLDDVDGGVVYFVSPTIDLSGYVEAKLSFYRWFYQRDLGDDAQDFYIAQVSDDNGASWVTLETLDDNQNANSWTRVSFDLAPVISLTNHVVVRFGASDGAAAGDLIELAIDNFQISIPCDDCNGNGIDDADDISAGASRDINANGIPDECEASGNPIAGGRMYDAWWADTGLPQPVTDHPLWQYRPDQTSNNSSGADTWRCLECHGWDYKGVSGLYATGPHRTGFPGILGTTLTEAELFTLLKEPPSNGGGPGVLNGHDMGSVLSDSAINDIVAFVLLGLVDDTPFIDLNAEFIGDAVQGETHFTTGGSLPCMSCHGADGTAINFGTAQQPEWLGTVATLEPWVFMHKARFGQPGSPMPSWIGTGGQNQGVADIGKYIQQGFPVECTNDGHCDDGDPCTVDSCGLDGYCVHAPGACAGACCLSGGGCQELTEADCLTQGGSFEGEMTECATASCAPTDVGGIVRDSSTLLPIENAVVTLQTTTTKTLTAIDGSFSLPLSSGTGLVIVGAHKGYWNASVTTDAPASGLEILLDPVPQDDNADYTFLLPETCAACHPNQKTEWDDSTMAKTGRNLWVHDLYNGSGTAGGMGGFVYTRDSIHAGVNPNAECASCHQPERWIANDFAGRLEVQTDPTYPSAGTMHGISCETCHKIADVDETKVNFPGIFPPAVTFTRPDGNWQVQYGSLPDVDYHAPGLMRGSYQPQLLAEVCAACHQDNADPNNDHTFTGLTSEPTYDEWNASAYSDPESPFFATCVTCHMPPSGNNTLCSIVPLVRDTEQVRSHAIEGSTPAFLENAVELTMQTQVVGEQLQVDVSIANTMVGHHVPTGVTVRNMILLVEAWTDGGDPLIDALPHTGVQTVHNLGGVGDPAQGYYAGLPGKLYGKYTLDGMGQGPAFFTDAEVIVFDNRIPALATDDTSYAFNLPVGEGNVHVRARLIYRRAWRALVDVKNWTLDGHNRPLADIAAPHYGHLMEIAEDTIPFSVDCTIIADGDMDGADGTNGNDIALFVEAMLSGSTNAGDLCHGDFDNSGTLDAADVPAMVNALLAQ